MGYWCRCAYKRVSLRLGWMKDTVEGSTYLPPSKQIEILQRLPEDWTGLDILFQLRTNLSTVDVEELGLAGFPGR
jgi:hypothetical protein